MDGRFTLKDGVPASHHMNYESFCRHFLEVFDELVVVGRLYPEEDPAAAPVTGPRVRFVPLPAYRGPEQFLRRAPEILKTLNSLFAADACFLLRVPGTLPLLFSALATARGTPFFVQCVADPADQLGAGAVRHPLRRVFRKAFVEGLRWQCRAAKASMYVTREALQRRYPPAVGRPTYDYTDLVLDPTAFVPTPRVRDAAPARPVVVNVGMMLQLYKGQDVLIEAARLCADQGLDLDIRLVGDGPYRPHLEQLARDRGVADRVTFVGKLAGGAPVRKEIDAADVFALPSRQEGLPRALMEAMARGVPAVGTAAGGIPELLDGADVVPPGDAVALARWLSAVARTPGELNARSCRNLRRAQDYRFEVVRERRLAFYRDVRRLAAGALS